MFFKDITLKESSTLKANGRLIVGNTVLFQISVASDEESVSGKIGFAYHLYLLVNFPRAAILDYMTSYGCPIVMRCFLTIAATK